MSTNGVIARATGEGTFKGVYHHSDGYPTGLGQFLTELLTGHFANDLPAMLRVLIDEHPAGWSIIVGKDFSLTAGYTRDAAHPDPSDPLYRAKLEAYRTSADFCRPQCYCHGKRHEKAQEVTEKSDVGPWAYVFEEEERILHVCHYEKHPDTQKYFYNDVARIELDHVSEVNWTHIECGENFERCGHYAWYHDLQPKTSNLGTQTFLGRRPLEMHDAIGFIVNGKRYKNTGCGGTSNFFGHKVYPHATWIATVQASNGRRLDIPVATIDGNSYHPYRGVQWIFPPTAVNPKETVRG